MIFCLSLTCDILYIQVHKEFESLREYEKIYYINNNQREWLNWYQVK